jgi:hypothetical protein
MTCPHQPCPNFEARMRAENKAHGLRLRAEEAEAEIQRLRDELARVGVRVPDTRELCGEKEGAVPCMEPAYESGLCVSHWGAKKGVLP